MLSKRTAVFSLALLLTACSFGCGSNSKKTDRPSSRTEPASADTAEKSNGNEDTGKKSDKDPDLSLGMMDYAEKSRRTSANVTAKSLMLYITEVFTENDWISEQDIAYLNTSEGELAEQIRAYYDKDDTDYIIIFGDNGLPKNILVCEIHDKKEYIGISGDIEDAYEIKEMKWKKILERFGFEKGEYSDIKVKENDLVYTTEPKAEYDLDDPEVTAACELACTIGWEFNRGFSDEKLYKYGKWSKDTPFTADFEWDVPEHGDIEYITEMYGYQVGRVLCCDLDSKHMYVGDSDFGYGYDSFADKSWAEVLEHFGYTQGEYEEH